MRRASTTPGRGASLDIEDEFRLLLAHVFE
jgi:hypothetical protein